MTPQIRVSQGSGFAVDDIDLAAGQSGYCAESASTPKESIAIIGIGCRFPGGASSPSSFWDLLEEPVELSSPVPSSRFSQAGFFHDNAAHHGTTNSRRSYFLQDDEVQKFDAAFFNISPHEAEAMDPQHRLLLEVVYEGLEDAGIPLTATSGTSTAAYVGLMSTDWQDLQLRDIDGAPRYLVTGGARSIASNRLSYFFNWHGPSETIDTACSSSLVAVHHAVQALRSGDASMAVAAGTNLLLAPDMYIMTSNLNMLSPTGKCQMWSTSADGYARGEGVACVILKTLSNALTDGDHIYAVVRETGVNQDGRTTGITMPSSTAQTQLIRDTYAKAGLNLTKREDRCQFFEAHGTGTPAGDPLEAQAIWDAFFPSAENMTYPPDPLYVGSVKTIMGHLEGCAGLAGLIKTALGLQRGFIPANLHLGTPNPKIAPMLGPGRLIVATEHTPWPGSESCGGKNDPAPRRASVNSFGFGGTNAHAILESFNHSGRLTQSTFLEDSQQKSAGFESISAPTTVTLVISAACEISLAALVTKYADYLEQHPAVNLNQMAQTLQKRRTRLRYGKAFAGSTRVSLVRQMRTAVQAFQDGGQVGVPLSSTGKPAEPSPDLLGIFTGQGAQWAAMGMKLLNTCPVFAQTIRKSAEVLSAIMASETAQGSPGAVSWSLMEELRAPVGQSHVGEAEFAQPLSTAVQVALIDVLREAGAEFSAVVGHSSGELAAAYAAGYISAADAMRMAYFRGRFSKLACSPNRGKGGKGGMLAVALSWDDAQSLCQDTDLEFCGCVHVAANNAPNSVTLSGDLDKLRDVQSLLRDRNVPAQMLRVDKAYHSPHMAVSGDAYRKALARCLLDGRQSPHGRKPCIWISSVHTDWEPISNTDPAHLPDTLKNGQYWVENMLAPVRFRDALEKLAKLRDFPAAVEVGPHPALRRQVADTWMPIKGSLAYHGTLARSTDDRDSLASVLGFLWQHGVHIDFGAVNAIFSEKSHRSVSCVSGKVTPLSGLPRMAWQHDRAYWRESAQLSKFLRRGSSGELIGHCVEKGLRYDTQIPSIKHSLDSSFATKVGEWRWRQILRLSELPWLHGHKVQGQVVFPAAGYCVMAMDAAGHLVQSLSTTSKSSNATYQKLDVVELRDVEIGRAIMLSEKNSDGVEIVIRLHNICINSHNIGSENNLGNLRDSLLSSGCVVEASFSIQAQAPVVGEPGRTNDPFLACFGRVLCTMRSSTVEAVSNAMPPFQREAIYLHEVSASAIYESYARIGLEYSAPFRVDSLQRCFGHARSTVRQAHFNVPNTVTESLSKQGYGSLQTSKPCFPVAALDNAFQTSLAAFASPGDGKLLAPYLPRTIGKLRMHIAAYEDTATNNSTLLFDAKIRGRSESDEAKDRHDGNQIASWTASIEGAISTPEPTSGTEESYRIIFQVEDLSCVNLVPSVGPYEEGIFSEEIWALDPDDALRHFEREADQPGDLEALNAVEQLAHYYMCQVYASFGADEATDESKTPWFIRRFWKWLRHCLTAPQSGSDSYCNPWSNSPDRVSGLMQRIEPIKHRVEVRILEAVAQNILRVMRQEDGPTILEVLFQNEMLPRLYVEPVMYARANRYLGRVASLISHRYPRCDILEVGAGTGGGTHAMFSGLQGAYGSYTFTDISSGFFSQAKVKFSAEAERMAFKMFDVERDATEQGLSPATYDIIIAANVLHATKNIEKALVNIRRLLKPGGFLLLLEVTAVDKVLVPFLMGAVPGWWLFEDPWREGTFSPLLTTQTWDKVLQVSGYRTGSDLVFHDMERADDHLSSLIVARATDEEWESFHSCAPLPTTEFRTNNLVIVKDEEGDGISQRIASNLETNISHLTGIECRPSTTITIIAKLSEAAKSPLLPNSTIIVLSDLSSPLLGDPTPADWEALKAIFAGASHDIVWVTRGRVGRLCPSHSMIVGLGRCARYENPGLKLRFVDLDDKPSSEDELVLAKVVYQTWVVQPNIAVADSSKSTWLHSVEVEVGIQKSSLTLPRLVPLDLANQRYLARRRGICPDEEDYEQPDLYSIPALDDSVLSSVSVTDTAWSEVQLSPLLSLDEKAEPSYEGTFDLLLTHPYGISFAGNSSSQLAVSLAKPSRRSQSCQESPVILLSPGLPQNYSLKANETLPISVESVSGMFRSRPDSDAVFLSVLMNFLVADRLCQLADSTTTIMAFEPSTTLEVALSQLAANKNLTLYVVTARSSPAMQQLRTISKVTTSWAPVYLHPQISRQRLKTILGSKNSGIYVDLCYTRDTDTDLLSSSRSIESQLSNRWKKLSEVGPLTTVDVRHREHFETTCDVRFSSAQHAGVTATVKRCAALAADIIERHLSLSASTLDHFHVPKHVSPQERGNSLGQEVVFDWSLGAEVAVGSQGPRHRLLPLPQWLFNPHKTYVFAGITSDLGLSVAKWMIQNGARSIALASRTPKIPAIWIEEMSNLGASDVRVFAMDVTNPTSVESTLNKIAISMNPVAGVVFGAMVLNDMLLENMSFDTLQATMAPKVQGTHLIEQYFHNTALDFFIFMSSMSAIVGIRGQSNYCAGNMYGRGVVAARRARGLPASTVDLSTVFGVGHFANAGAATLHTVHANLRGFNTLAISESDVLDAFHEAILRGPPNASATGDVIVGLGSESAVATDGLLPAAWHYDPRFGHFTARAGQQAKSGTTTGRLLGASDLTKNVRDKILSRSGDEERLTTLSKCFSAQIQETMQLPDPLPGIDVPLMDLGIDSLVAVDLRAWFFKELEVSVPVLSILNGESVKDLCQAVLLQI